MPLLLNPILASFRIQLSIKVGKKIKKSMNLLGIDLPERA